MGPYFQKSLGKFEVLTKTQRIAIVYHLTIINNTISYAKGVSFRGNYILRIL